MNLTRLFTSLLVLTLTSASAQEKSILQRAMQDELDRSMKELKLDTLAPPFYISYTVTDVKINTLLATLGGITNAVEVPNRSKGVRVLVGNYELNDESLDNNLFSQPEANEIALPLDDDYLGIRRAFWTTTDNVYKNAARQNAKNKADLRDQRKTIGEVPHRTFAQVSPVTISKPSPSLSFDAPLWEQNLRELSALFIHRNVQSSRVILNYVRGTNYFINSEGTSIQSPVQNLTLAIMAQTKTEEGEMVIDQLEFHEQTPEQLPSMVELKKQVTEFIDRVETAVASPSLLEEYNGPVLLAGPAVADVFAKALFQGRDQLIADNGLPNPSGYRSDRNAGLELKIGKSVASPNLTVTANPSMELYKGKRLLGAFLADSEGVVPKSELVLIDKGILLAQLNDRTLTQADQTANGHSDGPGVITVKISDGTAEATVKAKFIDEVKKEGLSSGLLIRSTSFGSSGIYNMYEVDAVTGQEKFIRSARFSALSLKNLKKILGSSSEAAAHNVSQGGNNVLSMIVPTLVLLGDMDVQPAEMPMLKEEVFVKSPLAKN
jgi:hypothetical protein